MGDFMKVGEVDIGMREGKVSMYRWMGRDCGSMDECTRKMDRLANK
jgi:hypothetical protein